MNWCVFQDSNKEWKRTASPYSDVQIHPFIPVSLWKRRKRFAHEMEMSLKTLLQKSFDGQNFPFLTNRGRV